MRMYGIFREGSQINQVICALFINLPVFAYGASIGWMSPMTLLLQSDKSPRGTPLTDLEVSWMAAVAYLVCIPGDFIMAFLGDHIGRKRTLMLISFANALTWIVLLSSTEVWALILARVLVGFSMAGCFVTCPIYTKEISDDNIRGALGSLVVLFHTTGNLFLYIIGDILSYNTILWICLMIPTFHLIVFMMMPETPSYLIKRGKTEEAGRVLAWLRGRKETHSSITNEIQLLQKEQRNDEGSNKFLIKAIFKDTTLFHAFRIAMVLSLAREVCGANPVLNFAGGIFSIASKENSLVLTPNQQAMLLGAIQVAGSALASCIIERTGRKFVLFTTSLISGLSMFALASWFLATDYSLVLPNWLPIVTLCLCIFCDSAGLAPMTLVILGEIFSFKYRGTVMAATMSAASFADFLQLLFFKPIANAIGIYASFYFFGFICVANAVYVLFWVPETKARCLDDIYSDLNKVKSKRKDNSSCAEYRL
ncbi:facilitated trehalose transporter Tret1-like [Zerene cesonia]|uniref:facilitated trehalose transporter Tret1-like n=1 Tax=Zerene cesonia TaxID=33412 RepID=UPI0018E50AF0|nr:facilitated trehalose transporter Tret1-like [Zerene cesonia]